MLALPGSRAVDSWQLAPRFLAFRAARSRSRSPRLRAALAVDHSATDLALAEVRRRLPYEHDGALGPRRFSNDLATALAVDTFRPEPAERLGGNVWVRDSRTARNTPSNHRFVEQKLLGERHASNCNFIRKRSIIFVTDWLWISP